MNKDNLLFAAIGLLFGFISGYMLQEVMVARQPLRRRAGEGAAVSLGPGVAGGSADTAGAPAPPSSVDQGSGLTPGPTPDPGAASPGVGGGPGGGPSAPPPAAMAEVQRLREYVATHPKDADAVLKLANLNFDINNWARARDLYTQYLGLRQPDPDVLTDLGTCYRQLRQFGQALEQFRHAERVAPKHWKSQFAETVVLAFDLNQSDAADKVFARLKAMAPGQPEVAQLGAEMQRRRGTPGK
jgi:hypothetical protein